MDTTCDWILGHRVRLEQPRKGFRVAVDTVLLAAAVRTETGQIALDLGCGVGGAMLALAARVPGARILGIEIQQELAELCRRNIERNGMSDRAQVVEGDIGRMRDRIPLPSWKRPGREEIRAPIPDNDASGFFFDHVLMNPPYHEAATHDLSPDRSKCRANAEQAGELAQWLDVAAAALKPKGWLTLIHRADRLEDILAQASSAGFGGGEVHRILPRENAPPSRVILRLEKGSGLPAREGKTLALHKSDGRYTAEAEDILRHAKEL